jgi:hypothetical protein
MSYTWTVRLENQVNERRDILPLGPKHSCPLQNAKCIQAISKSPHSLNSFNIFKGAHPVYYEIQDKLRCEYLQNFKSMLHTFNMQ